MKVLKGSLKETRYDWPAEGCTDPPTIKQETVFSENGVTYMSDQLGLHRISNPDPENVAISLHCERLIKHQVPCLICSRVYQYIRLRMPNITAVRSSIQKLAELAMSRCATGSRHMASCSDDFASISSAPVQRLGWTSWEASFPISCSYSGICAPSISFDHDLFYTSADFRVLHLCASVELVK